MTQDKRGDDAGRGDWQHGEDRQGLLAGGDYGHDDSGKEAASMPNGGSGGDQIRTPGRVRFNDVPEVMRMSHSSRRSGDSLDDLQYHHHDGDGDPRSMLDLEDPLRDDDDDNDHDHRRPLLTSMEAPSVALANDLDDSVEQELRRPKSGLKAAFMNMANSIIGAGIIGQPYAIRQAGLLAGVVLLVGLTVVVDWTICLIVINSKLSGTSSFQGTVQHCFGRPGLIAISLAQWVFAFGGMVAFGVIVGDTIPHVLLAVWPGLPDVPVIGLMTDRRVAITVFVMGISYPLTLYRDIAKLAKASTFALIGMVVIVTTVLIQGLLVPSEAKGEFNLPLLTVNTGIFQAIGVISFGKHPVRKGKLWKDVANIRNSICMPPQLAPHLRLATHAHH